MKRFLSVVTVILLATAASCSQSSNASNDKKGAAEITFVAAEHDFGTIDQGSDATCTFEFKNTGKEALLINNVQTSCGCTVPVWTREPVKKKKNGEIKIKYNTNHPGSFVKTITVYSNSSNSPVTLKIKGTVVPNTDKQDSTLPKEKK
jgi:archaellum component FlaG (FlaF/FlaG flagellin family)